MEKSPISYVKPERKYGIHVENLCKSYGSSVVLNNISMHVEQGTVYGLLGASGAGKTTLLSCILNTKNWDSGEVRVLGKRVKNEDEIDSKHVGSMPQDLALYDHLTLGEIMKYFSMLHGMTHKEFKKRKAFLEDLVNLPGLHSRCISNFSGGQKRRVSLSLAIIHNPKLLILDEPTVGLDPLLRIRIWDYLFNLALTNGTTICITTHYIEEVKYANRVGIMRKARLILEEDPAVLMRSCGTDILDHAVRQICYKDEQASGINSLLGNGSGLFKKYKKKEVQNPVNLIQVTRKESLPYSKFMVESGPQDNGGSWKEPIQRIVAYSRIIWILFIRHPVFIFGVIFLPVIQLITTGLIFGVEPKHVPIGVVNEELPNWNLVCAERARNLGLKDGAGNVTHISKCRLDMMSCDYIEDIKYGNFIHPIECKTTEEALHAVQLGDLKGFIQIPANFSENLVERAAVFRFASYETIDGTIMHIHMDKADFVTYVVVTTQLFLRLTSFVSTLTTACDFHLPFVELPIHFREPAVYGTFEDSAQSYVLPSIVAGIIFEISLGLAPGILLIDKRNGTLQRSKVAGLRLSEALSAIILTMGTVAFIQGLICYILMQYGLGFTNYGNLVYYFIFCFLIALCGGSLGLLLGVVLKKEVPVLIVLILILPVIMTHVGILRPEEVLSETYHYRTFVYYCFPSAAAVRSIRFIMSRGVSILHPQVWPGILITIVWSGLFSLVSLFLLKRAKE